MLGKALPVGDCLSLRTRFSSFDSFFSSRQRRRLAHARNDPGEFRLLTFYDSELLYPSAPIGLGNIDVAFGIDSQRVTVREITELMAGTAEGGENLSAGTVEGVNRMGL